MLLLQSFEAVLKKMINEIVSKTNSFHPVFIAFVSCFLKFFRGKVMYFAFFFTVVCKLAEEEISAAEG